MIFVDTSVWVEYLRGTGSKGDRELTKLISSDTELATTEPIVMEVLAGARDDEHVEQLRRLLYRCKLLHSGRLDTHEHASSIYRECRQAGQTVSSLVDCLIAAMAIENNAKLLHADNDYRVIATLLPLDIH